MKFKAKDLEEIGFINEYSLFYDLKDGKFYKNTIPFSKDPRYKNTARWPLISIFSLTIAIRLIEKTFEYSSIILLVIGLSIAYKAIQLTVKSARAGDVSVEPYHFEHKELELFYYEKALANKILPSLVTLFGVGTVVLSRWYLVKQELLLLLITLSLALVFFGLLALSPLKRWRIFKEIEKKIEQTNSEKGG